MGRVYKAEQLPIGRLVALKVLRHDGPWRENPGFQQRFLREASLSAHLSHPNLVTVYDYGHIDVPGHEGSLFIAMEYLEGETLTRRLTSRSGMMQPSEAISLIIEVARGLGYAHERGILHRDIKPDNIMILPQQNGSERVKLVDFGLVKQIGGNEEITIAGTFVGSPAYMSPEQGSLDELDARSDIYSLGVVLYQCLCGDVPFHEGNMMKTILAHSTKAPPRLQERNPSCRVPGDVEAVVMKMLAKSPAERFQNTEELLRVLLQLQEQLARAGSISRAGLALTQRPLASLEVKSQFQIEQELRQNPAVSTYEAAQQETRRRVVVRLFTGSQGAKLTPAGEKRLSAFARLQGRVFPRVLGVGRSVFLGALTPFCVLERYQGESLRGMLKQQRVLSLARALRLFEPLFAGLEELHALGVIHGNLSPSNLYVEAANSSHEEMKLLGMRLDLDANGNLSHRDPESARYLPPEPRGQVHSGLDLFAAGAILAEALTGEWPINPAKLAALPPEVVGFLRRACSPDPSERFTSASELLTWLRALSGTPHFVNLAGANTPSLSQQPMNLWVLAQDPALTRPATQEALAVLKTRFEVSFVPQEEQENLSQRLVSGQVAPPWAVLFGDLQVILENHVLLALREVKESAKILLSTHRNPEMLQQSINFCGLDYHICLPEAPAVIAENIEDVMRRARGARLRYDANASRNSPNHTR
jgi:serine/threonine protein kinase